jgi:hypothetical protein
MTITFKKRKKEKRKRDLSFSDKRCEKREKYGWMGLIYCCCTSGAGDRSRLKDGSASAKPVGPGYSERVSQLPHAAASSTPMGLGGGAGSTVCSLRRAAGHVSIRYSCISWRQLLTISCTQKQKRPKKPPKKYITQLSMLSLGIFLSKKKKQTFIHKTTQVK